VTAWQDAREALPGESATPAPDSAKPGEPGVRPL
jgi:hypothetical protein